MMKHFAIVMAAALALPACGGDDEAGVPDATSGIDAATPDASGPPPAPTLGAQIDRLGRPAIATALIDPFYLAGKPAQEQKKDAYNADDDPSGWVTAWAPDMAASVAVLDSLDTTCGNQILYTEPASAASYAGLAGVLAYDVLWVNAAPTDCDGVYLAVEANATGLITNDDCGGRVPAADIVDISYSLLAGVTFFPVPAVGDGIAANDVAFLTEFPYLAAPH